MHFDLLVVGAGPAGLSAAIKFKQVRIAFHLYRRALPPPVPPPPPVARGGSGMCSTILWCMHGLPVQMCKAQDKDFSVCVIEKGAEVGKCPPAPHLAAKL